MQIFKFGYLVKKIYYFLILNLLYKLSIIIVKIMNKKYLKPKKL
jgi:hypothetical protein